MARRGRGGSGVRLDGEADRGGLALDTESPIPPTGPHDGGDLDPELTDAAGLVDFGSIRVPLPPEGTVTVEPTANGRMQAVHIALPGGRLSVSALAAPKTSKLWPDLAGEIDASLREGGARVRSYRGEWGRELHATSGGATSVFVGVDGARWMLYGVATGPSAQAGPLDAELRRMLRGSVVVRGTQPYPVRTILPLAVPDHLAAEVAATPAATGTKKRSAAKAGAGKSAPGKAAPGKTAPPNSDAATAAAKKAAARRAAARKAAAAAAVKAAAEALAEQAAEDRAAAADRPDAGSAARDLPAAGTIPSGPGPDAPLREQAPSARRAAAAAWRTRPAVRRDERPPPAEAQPPARPVAEPAPTEALPVTPAARADLVVPAGGSPRVSAAQLPAGRTGEQPEYNPVRGLPAGTPSEKLDPPIPPTNLRREPLAPAEALLPTEALRRVEPGSGGRRRLGEPGPPPPPPPGRRRLPEPPVEEPRAGGRRRLREPAADLPPPDRGYPADPPPPEVGRRRLQEPGGVPGATAAWEIDAPGGRRRLRDPVAETGVSASGRRRLQEPRDSGPERPAVADAGVSATGRRRLRESWEPGEPVADTGVSATGRRRLREPSDDAAPPWETARGGPNGGPGGRRRLGEAPGLTAAAAADTGVSASGRRRLREPWDEAGPLDGDPGASGRRRLREPWDDAPRASAADAGVSATGRRHLREPDPSGPAAADSGVSATGRRRLRESWDEAGAGEPARMNGPVDQASGRRRLQEPWEGTEAGGTAPGRRRLRDPQDDVDQEPSGRRYHDPGEDLLSGTGRRRLRESAPPPARDRTQPEPWADGPGGPPHRSTRRGPADYLAETGEQDAGWATALDDYADRHDSGRHSGVGDGSPPTVRLETLLSELDPNRPRRRHRR
ncbi:DUF3710 domain-containing protein [Pseudonocardia sp. DLS-67]